MDNFIALLTGAKITELATDPRVLALAAAVFIAAILMRSKFLLLLLLGVGGVLAVIRYSNLGAPAGSPLDPHMFIFAGGILIVAVLLIYFLFVRGD